MGGVQLKCPKCGSDRFDAPRRELQPNDRLTCLKCGLQITGRQATESVANQLGKAIKGFKL